MKTPLRAAVLVALSALATACASSPSMGPGGDYLENTRWYVVSADGVRVPAGVDEAPFIVADPGEGRLRGHGGCNTFNGPYRAGGSNVAFGPFAMTRKACPALGDWEQRFVEALMASDGYRIEGGRLELMTEGRVRITLQAAGD